ncbi:hypothetical protein B0H14DRAFT_3443464 [Mycena olivaceomarginata]|nr:hypothetical protein B0H14DRAFT_3443464 [Mycena olivaceomarginata]
MDNRRAVGAKSPIRDLMATPSLFLLARYHCRFTAVVFLPIFSDNPQPRAGLRPPPRPADLRLRHETIRPSSLYITLNTLPSGERGLYNWGFIQIGPSGDATRHHATDCYGGLWKYDFTFFLSLVLLTNFSESTDCVVQVSVVHNDAKPCDVDIACAPSTSMVCLIRTDVSAAGSRSVEDVVARVSADGTLSARTGEATDKLF